MTSITLGELRWLYHQREPVWGGPMTRGEKDNPSCREAVREGLIKQVGPPKHPHGYVITEKGRSYVRSYMNKGPE